MATLYIEHSITDLQTWLGAFTRFEDAQRKAGVRAQRICQPVDDEKYIWVTLEFDRVEEAAAFKGLLETTVWASADASPSLGGNAHGSGSHGREYRPVTRRRLQAGMP